MAQKRITESYMLKGYSNALKYLYKYIPHPNELTYNQREDIAEKFRISVNELNTAITRSCRNSLYIKL